MMAKAPFVSFLSDVAVLVGSNAFPPRTVRPLRCQKLSCSLRTISSVSGPARSHSFSSE